MAKNILFGIKMLHVGTQKKKRPILKQTHTDLCWPQNLVWAQNNPFTPTRWSVSIWRFKVRTQVLILLTLITGNFSALAYYILHNNKTNERFQSLTLDKILKYGLMYHFPFLVTKIPWCEALETSNLSDGDGEYSGVKASDNKKNRSVESKVRNVKEQSVFCSASTIYRHARLTWKSKNSKG